METSTEKKERKIPSGQPSTPRVPLATAQVEEKNAALVSRYGDPRSRSKDKSPRRGGEKRRSDRRGERPKAEFEQKIISIRRVTRVVSGGRRFSFSVALVAGDKNGSVGVGIGKASDTALAVDKAFRDARRSMITVKRTKTGSIPYDVEAKHSSAIVTLRPSRGRGLVAGSSVRTVLELGGVKDVSAKLMSRSKNKLNNARAAVLALKKVGTIKRLAKGVAATEEKNKEALIPLNTSYANS
jgi:small subunit ribosomal protein S5